MKAPQPEPAKTAKEFFIISMTVFMVGLITLLLYQLHIVTYDAGPATNTFADPGPIWAAFGIIAMGISFVVGLVTGIWYYLYGQNQRLRMVIGLIVLIQIGTVAFVLLNGMFQSNGHRNRVDGPSLDNYYSTPR